MNSEIEIPEEYVVPLVICADATGLSLEEIIEVVLKFYLNRSDENA